MVDQRLMRLAAEKRAIERAARERQPCYVSRLTKVNGETVWYVTIPSEPVPFNASLEFIAGVPLED